KFTLPFIIHKTLLTAGVGESFLAEQIKDFETVLPENIKLAYLPSYGMVRLRLTSSGYDKHVTENEINSYFITLQSLVKENLVTNEDEPMAKVLGKLLIDKNKTMATAESCTGGYIAHLITTIPGSSLFYKGSIVSYDNEIKQHLLDVSQSTLTEFGAVSEETVKEMLEGVLNKIKAGYAIAVSGIMGPDGGTLEKPVGTVWIAVGNNQDIITQKIRFRFDRVRNIELTALNALNMLRKFILSEL
ncbi:MAG: nicotinamide-nucleotide amidohydrolase family protein, partial [Ginsengibacter sp.]